MKQTFLVFHSFLSFFSSVVSLSSLLVDTFHEMWKCNLTMAMLFYSQFPSHPYYEGHWRKAYLLLTYQRCWIYKGWIKS